MKKIALLFAFLIGGCSHTLLSTKGASYEKVYKGVPLVCAEVNEWDVSVLRPDKRSTGCWCRLPPVISPMGATVVFQLARDEFCQEGEVKDEQRGPVRKSSFDGAERL